jgi:hypothetical protein
MRRRSHDDPGNEHPCEQRQLIAASDSNAIGAGRTAGPYRFLSRFQSARATGVRRSELVVYLLAGVLAEIEKVGGAIGGSAIEQPSTHATPEDERIVADIVSGVGRRASCLAIDEISKTRDVHRQAGWIARLIAKKIDARIVHIRRVCLREVDGLPQRGPRAPHGRASWLDEIDRRRLGRPRYLRPSPRAHGSQERVVPAPARAPLREPR